VERLLVEQITSDEAEVRATVERFLAAIGRYDLDAVAEMFTDEASIGAASVSDGQWTASVLTVAEFLTRLRSQTNPTHYTEPVSGFIVHVDDGRLAFARADATLVVDGEPRRHNIDYFTLMRFDRTWKFISASYVSKPID
jgi:ketosteroid isomerase-like protein